MPRIRGRARGQLGPVAQSPCGLVIFDTIGKDAPALSDLLTETELYARAGGITTLRVAANVAPPGSGAGGRGAAELLAAISTLRRGGAERVAVVCAALPQPEPAITTLRYSRAERLRARAWVALPDGIRVVTGLASAIGSIGEVVRGVAAFTIGPVADPVVIETAPERASPPVDRSDAVDSPAPAETLAEAALPERDTAVPLARLIVTLPDGGLPRRERAELVGQIYLWLTRTLEALPARPARPARPAMGMTREEALAWLDDKWDAIIMLLAERNPQLAEQVWAMTETYIAAEGGYSLGSNMRAAALVRPFLDPPGQEAWLRAYGAIYRLLGPEAPQAPLAPPPDGSLHVSETPNAPDGAPPDPAEHSAS